MVRKNAIPLSLPLMFVHQHPYPPFLFPGVEKLIVGTLPPPRFSTGALKPGDVDFCYGSRDGQLWVILDRIFGLGLRFETTAEAIAQRKNFLLARKIGICDIVERAERKKPDASDLGMENVQLRELLTHLEVYPSVHTLLFTGGNSKNGPEYFFRRYLKHHHVALESIDTTIPRIHQFVHPITQKTISTVSLIAPSGSANRAIGSLQAYKVAKDKDPSFTTLDFRVLQYQRFF
ncbi:MAG: uracil-DNA glycosylase family protein [Bacteroidota bacterium]